MLKYIFLLIFTISFAQTSKNLIDFKSLNSDQLRELYLKNSKLKNEVLLDKMIEKAKLEDNIYNIVIGYDFKTLIEKDNSQIEKYLNNMITFSQKSSNKKLLPFSFYKKALHFCKRRKYGIALNNYLLANKYINKDEYESLYYDIQFDIAVIKSSISSYKETLPTFLEVNQYSLKKNKYPDLACIFAIAESYNHLNNLSKANEYAEYGKKWSIKLKNNDYYYQFLLCEGINLYKEKKYDKSIAKLLYATKNIKNDFANLSSGYFYLGKSYLDKNKVKKAVFFFEKVDSIFNKEKTIFNEYIQSYNYLINYYSKSKDLNKQLYYTNNLIKADSILDADYSYLINKINKEYEIPKLVKKKQELIDNLQSQKRYYLIFSFCIIIFLSISVLLAFKYFKNLKKHSITQQEYIQSLLNKVIPKSTKKDTPTKNILDDTENNILKCIDDFEINKFFLKKDCTLAKTAKEMNTNTSYLSKIINDKKGCAFKAYINGLRIDYCINELEKNHIFRKYNMAGIADLLGFNNSDSFARAFKAKIGINPSEYISKLENNNLKKDSP